MPKLRLERLLCWSPSMRSTRRPGCGRAARAPRAATRLVLPTPPFCEPTSTERTGALPSADFGRLLRLCLAMSASGAQHAEPDGVATCARGIAAAAVDCGATYGVHGGVGGLSLIHISEPTRLGMIS